MSVLRIDLRKSVMTSPVYHPCPNVIKYYECPLTLKSSSCLYQKKKKTRSTGNGAVSVVQRVNSSF